MAIMRTRARLTASAPPPSPIPTAKGSRSAAVNDEILSEYLEKSLQLPELTLPESSFPASAHLPVPAEIDYHSLVSRDGNSVDRFLKSAEQFAVIRINGHGISADELRSTVAEAEWVFGISEEKKGKFRRNYGGRNRKREEFVWHPSEKAMVEWAQEVIEAEKYRIFSQKMDNVASKLDAIARELGLIFLENLGKQFQKRVKEGESVMSLYRHHHDDLIDQNEVIAEENCRSDDRALSLHAPVGQGEFHVQAGRGPSSFHVGPNTIVVTVGELVEEWSLGEFESASGELIFAQELHGSQASFSIELKCSTLNLNHSLGKINKMISIADQILIALMFAILFKFLVFLYSWFRGT